MTKSEIKSLLNELDIIPLKSLGQNFLIDSNVIRKIVSEVSSFKPEEIIEIGPGLGSLTRKLIELHKKLTLVELDRGLVEYWKGFDQLSVVHSDALKINFSKIISTDNPILVSNLPYQISSRLLILLFEQNWPFQSMILMFQREVFDRLRAPIKDKSYGLVSVIIQLFFKIEIISKAPGTCFFPPPQIESAVGCFTYNTDLKIASPKEFVLFLKQIFSKRRKKLRSSLKPFLKNKDLGEVLDKRPEELNPRELYDLFCLLEK